MASHKKTDTSNHSSPIAGKLLLAMPSMNDQRFERAVIFMCAHDDNGAMGLKVNDNMPDVGFEKIIEQTGIKSDIAINMDKVAVLNGGPVDSSRGFLLHSAEFEQKDTIHISPDYAVSGTVDALKDVVEGNGPGDLLFILGHAGWSAGQLDKEICDNAWLIADATPELLFHTPSERKWEIALKAMGIDPANLSTIAGNA